MTRVELSANRGTHVIKRRTLTGAPVAALVQLANALVRDNRGVVHCGMDTGLRVAAAFVAPSGTLVFTENPACGDVVVTSNGHQEPALLDTPRFAQTIRGDLGLPPGNG